MQQNKISFLSGSLLWFGAAVSIAEIMTGTLIAPLGFGKGMLAIVLGHIIGCMLLFFAGLIGADSRTSAMESVRFSFGKQGSVFFSVLNILQLVGWTAVMIIGGARAFGSIINTTLGYENNWLWCIMIGVLIILWVVVGIKNVGKLNLVAVGSLLILTIVLGVVIFRGGSAAAVEGSLSFGMAMELSIAMPISWLPLISDYTKNTDRPVGFTLFSTLCYFAGSIFMYAIGLGAALFAGSSDIVEIMMGAGLGLAAMIIVVLSTVTTTYLDVYSAGESILNINPRLNGKTAAVAVTIIGTLIAIFMPIEQYENFLYLIGSVFAPMISILITDYFILGNRYHKKSMNLLNGVLWLAGFVIYRVFMQIDTVLGSTVPVMIIVSLLCLAANFIGRKGANRNV